MDWTKEMLELALNYSSLDFVRYIEMDCTLIDYNDNSFDSVVDTFGFQASYDWEQQYNEMKRVCKVIS